MSRIHIPGLVDVLPVSDGDQIRQLLNDPRLDRDYRVRGPLVNRLITGWLRSSLVLNDEPLPPVAPRGPVRPKPEQIGLERRLEALGTPQPDDATLKAIGDYVRGGAGNPGYLAQQSVGRIFDPQYNADAASWSAAKTLDQAPSSFNLPLRLWWALTGAVGRSRRLLADKVGGDPSGVHGTGLAVHNIVDGLKRMRALWSDAGRRANLSAEAAAAQCTLGPKQVLRQPTVAGESDAGAFAPTTLVLLKLRDAQTLHPGAATAFTTQSWSRCPAHDWVRWLLIAAWRQAGDPAHV